jgi:hypothetical protein
MAKEFSEMVFSRDLNAPLVKRGLLWSDRLARQTWRPGTQERSEPLSRGPAGDLR